MSCYLLGYNFLWGEGQACGVGDYTSWAPGTRLSPHVQNWLLLHSTSLLCGLPASMGCTVQIVCNAANFLATYPAFSLWGSFLFSWRWNSSNIKFAMHSCPIQWYLIHFHVAQPPPLLSFETLSTSSKTTLLLPATHFPSPPLPETPILCSISMVLLFWVSVITKT